MLDIPKVLKAARRKHSTQAANPLVTVWGEAMDPEHVLGEHPRPQLARDNYMMLNGLWEYAITPIHDAARRVTETDQPLTRDEALHAVSHSAPPARFDGDILVPFSPEAPLSGVKRDLQPNELLWYRRSFTTPPTDHGKRLLLHCDAVDWACACYVNGRLAATHVGGYLPFTVDITPLLRHDHPADGLATEIMLCVYDPGDAGTQQRGKQALCPGGIWYTAQSGIWQSVWCEVVPAAHLIELTLNGDMHGQLRVDARISRAADVVHTLHLDITDADGHEALDERIPINADAHAIHTQITLPNPHLWSPDDPYLYQVKATLESNHAAEAGAIAPDRPDTVRSTCAFRSVEVKPDVRGIARFNLNGKPYFLKGVLDQGYWPDGLLTAPSDEALIHDIAAMKAAGFNMLRNHIKIESARWYYHCDRLGMLIWQDAVSGGGRYHAWHTSRKPTLFSASWGAFRDDTPRHKIALSGANADYQDEWRETCTSMIGMLAGHPSIVTWVLFNEGWGQFDALEASERVHGLDPTRPIDATSGWYDQQCGDYLSEHNYFRPLAVHSDKAAQRHRLRGYVSRRATADCTHSPRAFVLSEFGGLAQLVAGHSMFDQSYGYGDFSSSEDWNAAVHALLAEVEALESEGLAGYVYTQVSDVEEEVNGLLTYDRRVTKLQP